MTTKPMETTAKLRYYRQAPRKVRLVANAIRGMGVVAAEGQLKHLAKRAALPVLKLLNSAVANAVHNNQLDKDNLYIKGILVDQGPTLRRYRPRARGAAFIIRKKSSHITIILAERESDDKSKTLNPKSEINPKSQDPKSKKF